jgi:hypothetical protein
MRKFAIVAEKLSRGAVEADETGGRAVPDLNNSDQSFL